MSAPTWTVRGIVGRAIDGDTFAVTLDLGWGVTRADVPGSPCRVRILSYNTPEKGQPDYLRATEELARALPAGTVVWLTSRRLDSFGRALCDVRLDDGSNLLDRLPAEWRT